MTENNQRGIYIIYFIVTLVMTICLALAWYMSPLGLGFAAWPEANRKLLEHIYTASYFIGIPTIVIVQVLSPILFINGKRKAAFWLPAGALGLFLMCIGLILSSVNQGIS